MNSRTLSFSIMDDSMEICRSKLKVSRDPMSHRIIEKRRRDRMNSCLADLSRLIPATYLKKGRGRIEKTEIIELAIKHLKQLQSVLYNRKIDPSIDIETPQKSFAGKEQFYLGYQECLHETTCYLVESEGLLLGDPLCVRLLNHLKKHGENVYSKGHFSDGEHGLLRRSNGVRSPESGCNSVSSFADVEGGDSQQFVIKKSPSSPSRYVSSPTIEVDSTAYDCADEFDLQHAHGPTLNNMSSATKLEHYRWPTSELLDNNQLRANSTIDSEVDPLHNIGGMSTCSRSSNRSDEVYKYKRNIKERFNADQKVKSDSDGEDNDDFALNDDQTRRRRHTTSFHTAQTSPLKRKLCENLTNSEDIGQPFKKNSQSDKARSFDNREPLDVEREKLKLPAIPIFALHPKGSYYVPMAIDSSVIMPQLNASSNFPFALHHIGISVSFANDFLGTNTLDIRTK